MPSLRNVQNFLKNPIFNPSGLGALLLSQELIEINAEKEKALQLSKIFEEQDNFIQGEDEDEEADNHPIPLDWLALFFMDNLLTYDLAGVKVLHGLDKVVDGDIVMLENTEIREQKRRDAAYKATKKKNGVHEGNLEAFAFKMTFKNRDEAREKRAETSARQTKNSRQSEIEEKKNMGSRQRLHKSEEVRKKLSSTVAAEEYERMVLVTNKNRNDSLVEARSVEGAIAQISEAEILPQDSHVFNYWRKKDYPRINNGFRTGCFTLYIDNLPENIHWKRFGSLFCPYGQVIDCFIPTKRNSKGVRFGFIRFATIGEARRAISKMNGARIDVLMIFEDSDTLRRVKNEQSETLAGWFSRVEVWSENLVVECRRVWVVCKGIPFHAWNWGTFKNIAARINESLSLKVGSNSFEIMVHEVEPSFKPNSWIPEEVDDSPDLNCFLGATLENSLSGSSVSSPGLNYPVEDVAIEGPHLEKHLANKSVDHSDGVSLRASEYALMMGLITSHGSSTDTFQLKEDIPVVPPIPAKLRTNRVAKKCKTKKRVLNLLARKH
ncbi:hypothetical protein F3Y22_tig00020138pilonHSYRG00069 [Hibiscus syriacus]|uniref:RRM domain-containing protein n=1 Tax=Hibiscus syriacus TaxID=106335 RepID=A0A6A3BZF0_HIBSY|nr:hypothetical protein F3Y22_tig00020138pilonHSYRG00069 [Hibiscus syriacus]